MQQTTNNRTMWWLAAALAVTGGAVGLALGVAEKLAATNAIVPFASWLLLCFGAAFAWRRDWLQARKAWAYFSLAVGMMLPLSLAMLIAVGIVLVDHLPLCGGETMPASIKSAGAWRSSSCC